MIKKQLDLLETEKAIKWIKDTYERKLAKSLKLIRVSAPLIVSHSSGINDYLSGQERPVSFAYDGETIEIVQSLAKWKRMALKRYRFNNGHGLYTDMNAIRQDEKVGPIHSLYVDQWDWEKTIDASLRHQIYLENTVRTIYKSLTSLQKKLNRRYKLSKNKLPKDIYFIDSQTLENMYPTLTSSQREAAIVKIHKAVFISQIGGKLASGKPHDSRSPDYDDWQLNGDIIFYNHILEQPFEISSMGIRVDEESLPKQLKEKDALDRLKYPYHQAIINNQLPLTIGGGIGQSRLCQFFLEKRHIGEVQVSYWPKEELDKVGQQQIELL